MVPFVTEFGEDAQALAEDRRVGFRVSRNERGEIRADSDLLRQLLLNLVANSVAASPPGGLVQLDSYSVGNEWRLTITDNGPGIPASDLPRIFERFVRVRSARDAIQSPQGHGLGLAICKSIAELHHGSIAAENRTDSSGLCVTVTLPKPQSDRP